MQSVLKHIEVLCLYCNRKLFHAYPIQYGIRKHNNLQRNKKLHKQSQNAVYRVLVYSLTFVSSCVSPLVEVNSNSKVKEAKDENSV